MVKYQSAQGFKNNIVGTCLEENNNIGTWLEEIRTQKNVHIASILPSLNKIEKIITVKLKTIFMTKYKEIAPCVVVISKNLFLCHYV